MEPLCIGRHQSSRWLLSTCVSELNASMTGMKLGIGIRGMIEDGSNTKVAMSLVGDNTAVIQSVTTEVTSWRNRHYAMRAAWVRYIIEKEGVVVAHRRGTELVSDALTKVLERQKLTEARKRSGLMIF